MDVNYINPFVTAAISVFSKMLGCPLSRRELRLKSLHQPEYDVSGVIGLSGKAAGTVVLSLSREIALNAAGALLGQRPQTIDADVSDAVGELTNIIAGTAKARLAELEMSVSLPTVITGRHHIVNFPSGAPPICIDFTSPWGPLSLEVSLVERAAGSHSRLSSVPAAAS